jgi:hypothetical protein
VDILSIHLLVEEEKAGEVLQRREQRVWQRPGEADSRCGEMAAESLRFVPPSPLLQVS